MKKFPQYTKYNIRNTSAFTLVELMIVVAIIAILVVLGIAYFRDQIFKGNDAKKKSDLNRIKIAIEEYEKDHNCYPPPDLVTCKPGTGLRPYLTLVPCDQSTNASYYYEPQNSVCPGWYRIYTKLDNPVDTSATPGIGPNGSFDFVVTSANAPDLTSGGGSTPSPSASGSSGGGTTGFYGCKSGVCVPIGWDSSRPGPECDPNFQSSTCFDRCSIQGNECTPWR